MLVTPKAYEAAKLMLACLILCIVMAVSIWAYKLYAKRVFSPPESGADTSTVEAPAQYISTSNLQRRLNKQYPEAKLVVDGKCGTQTQFWWDRAYGDQIAIELWPEDAK